VFFNSQFSILNSQFRVVWALALFSLINTSVWMLSIGRQDAPDEPAHLRVVAFEARHRRIPEVGVDDEGGSVRSSRDNPRYPYHTYSAQPPLAYILGAITGSLPPRGADIDLIQVRLWGPIFNLLTVLLCYAASREMFPTRGAVAVAAACLAAFWPQLTFVCAYFNTDGIATAASAALIWSWYFGTRRGWRRRDALLTGTLTGIVLLTKLNGYPIAALSILVAVATLRGTFRHVASRLTIALGAAAAVCGWWLGLNWSRYGADLFATGRARAILDRLNAPQPSGRYFGYSIPEMLFTPFPTFNKSWLRGTAESFFGVFGLMRILLPASCYLVALGIVLLALIGLSRFALRQFPLDAAARTPVFRLHLIVATSFPIIAALAVYRSYTFDYQAQGRHLLPAFLPFVAFLSLGLAEVTIGGRARRLILGGTTLTMLAINLLAYTCVLQPFEGSVALSIAIAFWLATTTVLVVLLFRFWRSEV